MFAARHRLHRPRHPKALRITRVTRATRVTRVARHPQAVDDYKAVFRDAYAGGLSLPAEAITIGSIKCNGAPYYLENVPSSDNLAARNAAAAAAGAAAAARRGPVDANTGGEDGAADGPGAAEGAGPRGGNGTAPAAAAPGAAPADAGGGGASRPAGGAAAGSAGASSGTTAGLGTVSPRAPVRPADGGATDGGAGPAVEEPPPGGGGWMTWGQRRRALLGGNGTAAGADPKAPGGGGSDDRSSDDVAGGDQAQKVKVPKWPKGAGGAKFGAKDPSKGPQPVTLTTKFTVAVVSGERRPRARVRARGRRRLPLLGPGARGSQPARAPDGRRGPTDGLHARGHHTQSHARTHAPTHLTPDLATPKFRRLARGGCAGGADHKGRVSTNPRPPAGEALHVFGRRRRRADAHRAGV